MTFAHDVWALRPALYKFAFSLCRNMDFAEDLASDTVVQAIRKQDQFHDQGPGALRAWTFTILRNFFLTYKKSQYHKSTIYTDYPIEGVTLPNANHALDLQDTLARIAKLPKHHREILELAMTNHMLEDMASILHIPMGTVKSRLNRARKLLQE